jgi:hypothetical protein
MFELFEFRVGWDLNLEYGLENEILLYLARILQAHFGFRRKKFGVLKSQVTRWYSFKRESF